MNIEEVLVYMKNNPSVKITMPHHYRSWQYNYYDVKKDKYLTENGEEWDIELSKSYNEIDGYYLLENNK